MNDLEKKQILEQLQIRLAVTPKRYFIHIPKVAGTSAFARFNDMVSRYVDYEWMLCNRGASQLKRWETGIHTSTANVNVEYIWQSQGTTKIYSQIVSTM